MLKLTAPWLLFHFKPPALFTVISEDLTVLHLRGGNVWEKKEKKDYWAKNKEKARALDVDHSAKVEM